MKPQQALFSTLRDRNLSLKGQQHGTVNMCHLDGKEDIQGKMEMKE